MSATARYRERPGTHPAVAAVWSFAAGAADASRIAADGCCDLIVEVEGARKPSAFVYAPVSAAHQTVVAAHVSMVGVRLHPGYGVALAGRADLVRAIEQLAEDGQAMEAAEAVVGAAIDDGLGPPPLVQDFVAEARAHAGGLRLTSSTSRRERQLQRACRRWLGLTPKTFLRIERAWAARAAIRAGTPLAAVAADLGYADQAHLTRELAELLGVTPRQLRPVGILQDGLALHR